jgi:hypothetical protein
LHSEDDVVTQCCADDWPDALFQESELTDVSWQPWSQSLGALLRSGNEDVPGNTLVLALRGVTSFAYEPGLASKTARAKVVDSSSVLSDTGGLRIDLSFFGAGDGFRATCAAAMLFSVDMDGQEFAPPDHGEFPAAQVMSNQPSWHSFVRIREVIRLR